MEIHEIIKEIRIKNRYSQEELSDRLGMTQAGYNKIERGATELTYNKLKQIAEVFKMSVVEIIEYPDGAGAGANDERVKELEGIILSLENDKKRFAELSDERKSRLIFLEKLTIKVADCLENGYAVLSKIEKQSPEIQKEIQDFVKMYDRLEEQIKMIDKET